MQKRGVPTNPINEQGGNKEKLIENLALLVEQKIPKFLYNEEVIFEFNDYEYTTTAKGHIVYGNASNDGHDDIVMATAFAFNNFIMTEMTLPWVGLMGGIEKTG